jgi:hypothetical protein
LTLKPDPIRDRRSRREGGPSGLHIAPFEALVTTVEVEHLALSRFCCGALKDGRSVSKI